MELEIFKNLAQLFPNLFHMLMKLISQSSRKIAIGIVFFKWRVWLTVWKFKTKKLHDFNYMSSEHEIFMSILNIEI